VCRQRTAVGPPLGDIVPAQRRVLLLGLGILFGNRLLERFQTQLQLFLRQPFGAGAEVPARQLQQQMTQSVILCQSSIALGHRRIAFPGHGIAFGHGRQYQRAQGRGIIRQARQGRVRGNHHTANPTRPRWV
jgi:hypothetical protein